MTQPQSGDTKDGTELVFALCHELGNLIGAIRLHAHLLDEEMGPKALAVTSVELDDLSARASALLGHVRPLLSSGPRDIDKVAPAAVVANVRQLLEEHGGRGVALSSETEPDIPAIEVDQEVLHQLLVSLLFAALEAASREGSVWLRAESRADGVAFTLEDDGEVDEDPAGWREQMMRGRPLLCAVASNILAKRRGHLEVTRRDGRTRVALVLPTG